jgi:hypothetical protein
MQLLSQRFQRQDTVFKSQFGLIGLIQQLVQTLTILFKCFEQCRLDMLRQDGAEPG